MVSLSVANDPTPGIPGSKTYWGERFSVAPGVGNLQIVGGVIRNTVSGASYILRLADAGLVQIAAKTATGTGSAIEVRFDSPAPVAPGSEYEISYYSASVADLRYADSDLGTSNAEINLLGCYVASSEDGSQNRVNNGTTFVPNMAIDYEIASVPPASYTIGKIAADELLYVATGFEAVVYSPATFSGAMPSEAVEETEEITREPGDYLTVFASKALAAGQRELLYTAPEGTTGVIREIVFTNSGAASSTVRAWLGGVLVEAGLSVPAGESRSQTLAGWLLPAGSRLEASSSGAGVNIFAFGVEEVS